MVEITQERYDDRVIKEVLEPPYKPISNYDLYESPGIPDWRVLRDHLTREGKLSKPDILELLSLFQAQIKAEPNILKLQDPVTVVGDLHGQFYDLLNLFDPIIGGDPENTKYLFLGDYVDRGSFSIECVLLLIALKLNYKNTFFMLRGNHECRQMTSFFNFKHECEVKYDLEVYERFMETFDCLPIACLINDKFLAIHGGISPKISKIEDIEKINRFTEPPKTGPMCDMLWSDPCEKDEDAKTIGWIENTNRGCSYIFGAKAATPFLEKNEILTLIRAHEAQMDGYKMHNWNPEMGFPSVITVFSAPNYCDVYSNFGAAIMFKDNNVNIKQYNCSPHPFILPHFMTIFNWSIPFVSEKISEMLVHIIKKEPTIDDKEDNSEDTTTVFDHAISKIILCNIL